MTYLTINQVGEYFNTLNSSSDVQNPLAFCLNSQNLSRFIHGSSSMNFEPYSENAQIYMAEYAAGNYNSEDAWNQYAQYYFDFCTSVMFYPNRGAINSANWVQFVQPQVQRDANNYNVGRFLLRNCLERVLFDYNVPAKLEPFFPNAPNSPLIPVYDIPQNESRCVPLLKSSKYINNHPLIKKIISDTHTRGPLSIGSDNVYNQLVVADVLALYNKINTGSDIWSQFAKIYVSTANPSVNSIYQACFNNIQNCSIANRLPQPTCNVTDNYYCNNFGSNIIC